MSVEALKEKSSHYRVTTISLYTSDLARMDEIVRQLKSKGHTKANRSQLIRAAIARLDGDAVAEIARQYGRLA